MSSVARFVVVEDPQDTRDHHQRIMALHAPAAGVAVMELPPKVDGPKALAVAGLRGLGRTKGLSAESADNLAALTAWLWADEVKTLVVTRGHLATPATVDSLALVAAMLEARVFFVCQTTLGRALRARLAAWSDARTSFDQWELVAGVAPTTHRPPLPSQPPPSPRERAAALSARDLPDTNFTTFRHDLSQRVDPEVFAVLDAQYTAAVAEATALCCDDYLLQAVEESHVARWLERTFVGLPVAFRLCALRGAQAGAFVSAVLISVNSERLLFRLGEAERIKLPADEVMSLVAREVEPDKAGIVGLLFATGIDSAELCDLREIDIAEDPLRITVAGQTLPLPEAYRPLLRAVTLYRAFRSAAGLSGNHILLRAGGEPYNPGGIRRALRELSGRSSAPLDLLGRERAVKRNWMYRHGLSMIRLAGR